MGRKSWVTEDQRVYLDGFRADWYEAQRYQTHSRFWAKLYEGWFAKWGIDTPEKDFLDCAEKEANIPPDASEDEKRKMMV
jgi:hypothetical protein